MPPQLIDQRGAVRDAWDSELLSATNELATATRFAMETDCAGVRAEHFVAMLLLKSDGFLARLIARQGMTPEELKNAILQAIDILPDRNQSCRAQIPLVAIGGLAPSAEATLAEVANLMSQHELVQCGELVLCVAALRNVAPEIQRALLDGWGFCCKGVSDEFEQALSAPVKLVPFQSDGSLDRCQFSDGALRILDTVRAEAEGLGYEKINAYLFLLGAVGVTDGMLQRALCAQLQSPIRVHEAAMRAARAGSGKKRSQLQIGQSTMHQSVQRTVETAAKIAMANRETTIGESHLLRAFLSTGDPTAIRMLLASNLDAAALEEFLKEEPEMLPIQERAQTEIDPDLIGAKLRERVVGQDAVIDAIIPLIAQLRFGWRRPRGPLRVFLFLGSSGVGKTELAQQLAEAVYGSPDHLLTLEMGQFSAAEDKSMLIGAAPGYKGYGDGQLTNGLRDNPRSVVLFDEIEKAARCPAVFDVILRFLDEGLIRDPAGPVRDGRQCVVILTSNQGAGELTRLVGDEQSIDAHELRRRIREQVSMTATGERLFRDEFINRIDELIVFRDLERHDLRQILVQQLRRVELQMGDEHDVHLTIDDDSVVPALLDDCLERIEEGARICGRLIERDVVVPVIRFVTRHRTGRQPIRVRATTRFPKTDIELTLD